MPKSRDYKAENARRTVGKIVEESKKLFGESDKVSFWGMANHLAITRLLPENEYKVLVDSGKLREGDSYKLLEIARYDQATAVGLLKTPEIIGATYKKLKRAIDATRPRRVDASTRFKRSWLNYINRFLSRFAPEDFQKVLLWAATSLYENMAEETKEAFRSWQESTSD